MSTRLDLVLQKHPEHEEGIRLLASRDPSGNLKYIDWGVKVLVSKQALAPEIADVLDLFHRFNGRWLGAARHDRVNRIGSDIYTYRPQDLASLRDKLLKIKRITDSKRRKRERLYHIEGTIEADTVHDSTNLIVRHIKNKNASVHYGLGTKWCISMSREGYFEDYDTHNATFFFFERKTPVGDEFDKVALMVPRNDEKPETAEAFTALDQHVDMMALAKAYGSRVFDIFREIYERSERYPGSFIARVYAGNATQEQLEAVFASIVKGGSARETNSVLRAICCNDAAPQALLEEITRCAAALSIAALKRRSFPHRRHHRRDDSNTKELTRAVIAAVSIHPNVSADVREKLTKDLRRRRVITDTIRLEKEHGRVGVLYETRGGSCVREQNRPPQYYYRRRHRRRRPSTVKAIRARAKMFDRLAAGARKKAKTLQRKLTAAKEKKLRVAAARNKRRRLAT